MIKCVLKNCKVLYFGEKTTQSGKTIPFAALLVDNHDVVKVKGLSSTHCDVGEDVEVSVFVSAYNGYLIWKFDSVL